MVFLTEKVSVIVCDVCWKHGVSKKLFCTWKRNVYSMKSDDIRELKLSKPENHELKQIVAVQILSIDATNNLSRGTYFVLIASPV